MLVPQILIYALKRLTPNLFSIFKVIKLRGSYALLRRAQTLTPENLGSHAHCAVS